MRPVRASNRHLHQLPPLSSAFNIFRRYRAPLFHATRKGSKQSYVFYFALHGVQINFYGRISPKRIIVLATFGATEFSNPEKGWICFFDMVRQFCLMSFNRFSDTFSLSLSICGREAIFPFGCRKICLGFSVIL